jgi:hypothetical protein
VKEEELKTFKPQKPIWSQGSEYPVTPKAKVKTASKAPVSHVNSRGFLNPPVKYTRQRWRRIANRTELDAHR